MSIWESWDLGETAVKCPGRWMSVGVSYFNSSSFGTKSRSKPGVDKVHVDRSNRQMMQKRLLTDFLIV
jgi:hypothetical protein